MYLFQRPLIRGIHPLILCFGLLGALCIRRDRRGGTGPARALLAGLLGLHVVVLLGLAAAKGADYLSGRHFLFVVLYALPFAGAGLAWVIHWGAIPPRARRWLPVAGLSLLVAVSIHPAIFRFPGRKASVERVAAAWIKAHAPGTPIVVTYESKLTYLAGAKRVDLRGSYEDILRRGRTRGAQFVAFYPHQMRWFSEDFLRRINAADLELVRTFPVPSRKDPSRRLEIYRLRPAGPGMSGR